MASFVESLRESGLDSLAIFFTTSTAVKFVIWWRSTSGSIPRGAVCVGHVTALHLYPVKSVPGFQLTEAQCTASGLKMPGVDVYDRRWMVTVGSDCRFVTARQRPQLLTVKLTMDDTNNELCFTAPGMNDILRVPLRPEINTLTDPSLQTKVWGQSIDGWDCGEEAAEWFSRFLNEKDHRLLYNPGVGLRAINRKNPLYVNAAKPDDQIAYHDDGPFLVVNSASLDDLNKRLAKSSDVTSQESDVTQRCVTMDYFRPSITVSGESPASDEDTWDELFIGTVKMTQLMPCARCMLTTIDPVTGLIRKDGEPLKTLRSYRLIQENNDSPCFGTYFMCDRAGTIRVGDPVFAFKRNRLQ